MVQRGLQFVLLVGCRTDQVDDGVGDQSPTQDLLRPYLRGVNGEEDSPQDNHFALCKVLKGTDGEIDLADAPHRRQRRL